MKVMKFTKADKRDLLKLADIIEKKEFFNRKYVDGSQSFDLPEDKRDGNQFNLKDWFFHCGMPACAAGHAVCHFPGRFGYNGYIKRKRRDRDGEQLFVNFETWKFIQNLKENEKLKTGRKNQKNLRHQSHIVGSV